MAMPNTTPSMTTSTDADTTRASADTNTTMVSKKVSIGVGGVLSCERERLLLAPSGGNILHYHNIASNYPFTTFFIGMASRGIQWLSDFTQWPLGTNQTAICTYSSSTWKASSN
jgi:hypothetical protein